MPWAVEANCPGFVPVWGDKEGEVLLACHATRRVPDGAVRPLGDRAAKLEAVLSHGGAAESLSSPTSSALSTHQRVMALDCGTPIICCPFK